jgi:hypothetical protein
VFATDSGEGSIVIFAIENTERISAQNLYVVGFHQLVSGLFELQSGLGIAFLAQ